MSDAHEKDKKPAAEETAGAGKAAKGGMLVPLIAAALISVGGSFGVGFFLNKQLLSGINKELALTLAQVGASEDHGDSHGAAKDPKATVGAHGADSSHAKSPKDDAHSKSSDHGAAPKKADAAAGHDAPKAKDDGHGGGGAPAKKETPEEIAKAAQIKAGLFPLGTDPIVANPAGDSHPHPVEIRLPSWTIERDWDLRNWLFRWGAGIRIEQPLELRALQLQQAREVVALHRRSSSTKEE